MATVLADVDDAPGFAGSRLQFLRHPNTLFWFAALVILGGCAANAALGHWLHQSSRDLYQHMAAIRALIADIGDPQNPYVQSAEGSRHFHPYWVMMAGLARTFDWTMQQTFAVASFFTMGILAIGINLFGRTYFRSNWGPLALLLCTLLAWSLPISHTGFLNVPTLVDGASYPAQLLTGLSFILWALVIRAFRSPPLALFIVPLVALMFATHQLGAGLGLIVASSIVVLWPEGSMRSRGLIVVAIAVGLLVSSLWPYFNPFEAVLRAGNATWKNGVEWFSPKYLFALAIPSAIGIWGLHKPMAPGTGLPLLAALPILLWGFIAGRFGFLTGTRFAPVAIILLQIGMATILVRFLERPGLHTDRFKLRLAGFAFGTILFQVLALGIYYYPGEYRNERRYGNAYARSLELTSDIPDYQEVAAYDVAAWPIAASGQKVLSVPWPEPMISDLPQRQQKIELLFDPRLTRAERVSLAKQFGVRTLILDKRFGSKGRWKRRAFHKLVSQANAVRGAGPLVRLDLYQLPRAADSEVTSQVSVAK